MSGFNSRGHTPAYAIMLLSTASAALGLWATMATIAYTFFHESIQFAGSLTYHPPLATALSMPLVLTICLLTLFRRPAMSRLAWIAVVFACLLSPLMVAVSFFVDYYRYMV